MLEKLNKINNSELTENILLSKATFCWVKDDDVDKYFRFDSHCNIDEEITDEIIEDARRNRAKRLKIDIDDVKPSDVVIRIKSWDHIPKLDKPRRNTNFISEKYERVNFQPFIHVKYTDDTCTELETVSQSHWEGSLDNGHFSTTHGQYTNDIATIFYTLVEKIGCKSNWNGYTFIDESKDRALLNLIEVGLTYDETRMYTRYFEPEVRSVRAFTYFTQIVFNSFKTHIRTEKREYAARQEVYDLVILPNLGSSVQKRPNKNE